MSESKSKSTGIEIRKFELNVRLTDAQGMQWFLLSFGLVIYFWGVSTPAVWNDQTARLVLYAIVFGLMASGAVKYAKTHATILEQYKRLCAARENIASNQFESFLGTV